MYRGPMVIMAIDRSDLVKCKVGDLITNQESVLHANRRRPFKHPKDMFKENIEFLAATDLDEFYVEKILDILARGTIQRSGSFEYVGSDMNLKTMMDWSVVKDFAASTENLHLISDELMF